MNQELPVEVDRFLAANDFSDNTRKSFRSDLVKFVRWFEDANGEAFDVTRITVRDVADFRQFLRERLGQAVATTNRCLVAIRRFLAHLVSEGVISANPAASVKELRQGAASARRGLGVAEVRRILRALDLRGSARDSAIIHVMLHGGLRVGDVVGLELGDVMIKPRSGLLTCKNGKGRKARTVPLSKEARNTLGFYLSIRPPAETNSVFVGERGALTTDGIRAICKQIASDSGVDFTPHTLRHTFARQFLKQTNNDLIALQIILGHESVGTTQIYCKLGQEDLERRVEDLRYA